MISVDKIKQVKRIVVHTDADGVASAMILKDVIPHASVEYVQYDTKAHLNMKAEPGMIFCDFSPHASRVDEFLEVGAIVLDHHKTTRPVVDRFIEKGLGAFGDEAMQPGVCGATLAYEHIWKRAPYESARTRMEAPLVEDLATLAGIRDTWQKNDPRWREACEQAAAINFWDWEKLVGSFPEQWSDMLKPVGKQAFTNHLRMAQRCVNNAYRFGTPKGLKVVMFQGYTAASDGADMVGDGVDIICGFSLIFEDNEPYALFSLRSRTEFDVGEFAKASASGGGGHAKSAGFRRALLLAGPNPYKFFRDLVLVYEDAWMTSPECTCGEDNGDGGPSLPHKTDCPKVDE